MRTTKFTKYEFQCQQSMPDLKGAYWHCLVNFDLNLKFLDFKITQKLNKRKIYECFLFYFQAIVLDTPRTSGRQRKKMDYKAMNEGFEFIEKQGTKLKTSRNRPSLVAASVSSSMASSSGVSVRIFNLNRFDFY